MKMKTKKTGYEKRLSRRRTIAAAVAVLLAILMIGGLLASALQVFAITKGEVDALKNKVNAAASRKKELKTELANLANDLSALEKQIALLDGQIEAQEDEIAAQEELLTQLNQLVEEKTLELQQSQQEEADQYALMRSQLRYMVENGSGSYLAILLASDSFSDFLNRYEIIKQISLRSEKIFEDLKDICDRVAVEKAELEQTRQEAEDTKAQMEANQAELERQREAKVQQLASLQSAQADVQKAYADMIEKEDQLMEEYKKAAAQLAAQNTYVGGDFMWPLPATNNVVTDPYGYRNHPVTGVYKLHTGNDLRASTGTKVYATNGGTVTTSGYSSAWGNYIIINHGGGYTSLYAHLSRRLVAKGDTVKQGAQIGLSGNTGYSTAPHLHFEMAKDGKTFDAVKQYFSKFVTYK